MFDEISEYRPILYYCIVKWNPPQEGWIKCNTDGASKSNLRPKSYVFCLRDNRGKLIYAEAKRNGFLTNMGAEIKGNTDSFIFLPK